MNFSHELLRLLMARYVTGTRRRHTWLLHYQTVRTLALLLATAAVMAKCQYAIGVMVSSMSLVTRYRYHGGWLFGISH